MASLVISSGSSLSNIFASRLLSIFLILGSITTLSFIETMNEFILLDNVVRPIEITCLGFNCCEIFDLQEKLKRVQQNLENSMDLQQ